MFYLHWQLIFYRDKRRVDPEMSPFAANLSDEAMADLAAYYATQLPLAPPGPPPEAEKAAAGRLAAERHHCTSCHARDLTGQQYAPRLVGLSYEYLLRQLRGFKAQSGRGERDPRARSKRTGKCSLFSAHALRQSLEPAQGLAEPAFGEPSALATPPSRVLPLD